MSDFETKKPYILSNLKYFMDILEFESTGVKFKVTNVEESLRNFYVSQKIDPKNDSEVVFYLKNLLGYHHVSHCNTISEERPFLEMSFIMDLAEQDHILKGIRSKKELGSPLYSMLTHN